MRSLLVHILLACILCILAVVAYAFRPSIKMSDSHNNINLETIIPTQFAGWKLDPNANSLLIDPVLKRKVENTYLQSLSRTYVNASAQRVMLAIAYGGDQNDMLQVHKPEVCYTAQGFQIRQSLNANLVTGFGDIAVRHLIMQSGERTEPVTYWVTIGGKVAVNPFYWRFERIRYGLTGVLPDGLLFRVSSIGKNSQQEYEIQQQFIHDLLGVVSTDVRERLAGSSKVFNTK